MDAITADVSLVEGLDVPRDSVSPKVKPSVLMEKDGRRQLEIRSPCVIVWGVILSASLRRILLTLESRNSNVEQTVKEDRDRLETVGRSLATAVAALELE